MNTSILKCADHLEPGAIPNMTKTLESMTAKGTLQDVAIAGAIKERAPLFQFTNTIGSFLRMNLGHAPVVQKLPAAHRIAKMRAPIIRSVDIRHRRRNTTLSHDG